MRQVVTTTCSLLLKVKSYLILSAALFVISAPMAEGTQNNVNQVTSFFSEEIQNKAQLEQDILKAKTQAHQSINSDSSLAAIGISKSDVQDKTAQLNSISANDLESKGQEERGKEENRYYDQLEVNLKDPQIMNHKKDIDKIAEGSIKFLSNITSELKAQGIDCTAVKGNLEREANFYIDIQKEHLKETVYNQHICEELRNKYSCKEELTVKCIKRGIVRDPWENRVFRLDGRDTFWNRLHWLYSEKWKKRRFWHFLKKEPLVESQIRNFIATKEGLKLEDIDPNLQYSFKDRGEGHAQHITGKAYVWDIYRIGYRYSQSRDICVKWQEDLNERCRLQ